MRSCSHRAKIVLSTGLLIACLGITSIDPLHKFSWSENIGWINWADAGGGAQGVQHHGTFLSGFAWSENVGWINFGDGTPADGTAYANIDGTDTGVNVLPDNNLTGFAWGENIGWINFNTLSLALFNQQARWDPVTGRFRGYAWGENIGWINLDGMTHYVAVVGAMITSWRSVRTHGAAGPQSIVLDAQAGSTSGIAGPTSESREGGIQRIEIDFNVPVSIADERQITVIGRTTSPDGVLGPEVAYLPASITSVSAATIAITFPAAPAAGHLPDQTCYTITLGSVFTNPMIIGDLDVHVRALLGDTTGSGNVTLSDVLAIENRYNHALSTDARFDVDLSGVIDNQDTAAAKKRVASPTRTALCQ